MVSFFRVGACSDRWRARRRRLALVATCCVDGCSSVASDSIDSTWAPHNAFAWRWNAAGDSEFDVNRRLVRYLIFVQQTSQRKQLQGTEVVATGNHLLQGLSQLPDVDDAAAELMDKFLYILHTNYREKADHGGGQFFHPQCLVAFESPDDLQRALAMTAGTRGLVVCLLLFLRLTIKLRAANT